MSSILSKVGSSLPLCLAILFLLFALYGLYWLITKKQNTFWTIFITAFVVVTLVFALGKYIVPKLTGSLQQKKQNQVFIYDTDPRNDEFIKGSLKKEKQKKLDYVLMKEKEEYGLRLSNQLLNQYAKYDSDVIAGYNRWRKCKEMRRSHHHVIYPDERNLYLK